MVLVLFVGWAVFQKDDMSTSAETMATSVLRGVSTSSQSQVIDDKPEVELTEMARGKGEVEAENSEEQFDEVLVTGINPMAEARSKTNFK